MARSPKRPRSLPKQQQFTPSSPVAWSAPSFPFGVPVLQVQAPPTEDRNIAKEDFKDSSVILNDGATITVKPLIHNVKKIVGQTGPAGEPLYAFQLTWTIQTKTQPKQHAGTTKSASKASSK
jgi:hypothetical protein